MMYSIDEIGLVPAVVSEVKHRGDVNPFVKSPFGGEKLPIFVSPMTCIIDAENICTFSRSKVEPIMPVRQGWERLRLPNGAFWEGWTAMTLEEFKATFNAVKAEEDKKHYVLIDVANGHMKELFSLVKDAKQEYGNNLVVMIGNIANPETYKDCCEANVDYVRVGIGGGSGCTTSVQTGIHTSMPYILEGITNIKRQSYKIPISEEDHRPKFCSFEYYMKYHNGTVTKIVADGGVTNVSRAIKCLALGADYVMMGRMFAQCEEACGELRPPYPDMLVRERRYYGQSSEKGQLDRFGKVKSNPEGTDYWIPITTNLVEFTTHFEAALRSAMSYCNANILDDFIGKVKYEYMSPMEFNAFNK